MPLLYELVALATGRRQLHRVRGASMAPRFRDGDAVIVREARAGEPRPGQVVVVRHPFAEGQLLKRVATVSTTGALHVVGDADDASTDSRSFGAVPATLLLGVVTRRLS